MILRVAYIEYAKNNPCQGSQGALIPVVTDLAGTGEAIALLLREAFDSGWSELLEREM